MDNLASAPWTLTLNKAGLAEGTTTTFSTTANPLLYAIKSKAYSLATKTNATTPTTDARTGAAFVSVPANYGSVYVWGVDAAGTVKVYQGGVEKLDGAADGADAKFVIAPQLPPIPDNVAIFAYTVVKVGASGSAFSFGSVALKSASNIGVAHQDVIALPERPQVA